MAKYNEIWQEASMQGHLIMNIVHFVLIRQNIAAIDDHNFLID